MSTNAEQTFGRSSYAGFRATIKTVGTGPRGSRSLTFEEARDAMRALLAGEVSDAQAGAFLIAMRTKGEEPEELAGLAQALRDAALSRDEVRPSVVACAGAYDGVTDSPQLSLAAAVVAAAAGAPCAVHCGERIGPKYGTSPADVLAALGGPARPTPDQSRRMLAESGVTVVHVGEAIPGWDRLARIRDEIGLRGPIHSAEKLVDHFKADRFIVGYTHQPYGPRIVSALDHLGATSTLAIRGIEGSDVPRPARPQASGLEDMELPQRLDLRLPPGGATPTESAEITRTVLTDKADGPITTAVVLGAMLRLRVAGVCDSVASGIAAAREAIANESAVSTLDRLLTSSS